MPIETFPAFFAQIAPAAERVANAYGLRPGLIMALSGEETSYGRDEVGNNLTGIRFVGQAGATGESSGGFAEYASLDAWATDMIRVLGLPYYQALRATAGGTIDEQVQALAASPYNGAGAAARQTWGNLILEVYNEQGLSQYDGGAAPTPAPTPGPTVSGDANSITIVGIAGVGALGLVAVLVSFLANRG